MWRLIRYYQQQDPLRPSILEVILVYPGFHATSLHRLSNWLWRVRLRLIARLLAHFARGLTGIEIHPAAQIGRNLFIDHGMGIVIGETAIIGDNVTIYHGVTLGGLGIPASAGQKRHPTIGNNVILGAGAKVIGNIYVADGAKIGPNAVVTANVPAYTTYSAGRSWISKSLEDWVI
jgi:serine O-acetyltransferase